MRSVLSEFRVVGPVSNDLVDDGLRSFRREKIVIDAVCRHISCLDALLVLVGLARRHRAIHLQLVHFRVVHIRVTAEPVLIKQRRQVFVREHAHSEVLNARRAQVLHLVIFEIVRQLLPVGLSSRIGLIHIDVVRMNVDRHHSFLIEVNQSERRVHVVVGRQGPTY